MSEIVLKEIKLKIYKNPFTNSQMHEQMLDEDVKIKKLAKDAFYLGEIRVDDRIYGVLELEKEYWADRSTPEVDYLDRIILKLHDKTGKTIGMIEERLLKELMQSTVSGKLPVFTITLKGNPYMIDIEKESDKLVFPVLTNKSKNIFEIFVLNKKSLAIGADYTVTRKLGDQKVADIDSKRGGKIEIKIYDDEVANNKQFIDTLALFAATIKFHDGIGKKIEQAIDALKVGELVLKPPKKALELMVDPRRVKRAKKVRAEEEEEPRKTREKRRKRKIRGEEEEEAEEEEKPKKKRAKKKPKKPKKDTVKSKKFKELYLEDPVQKASGVTKAIAKKLEDLGILTVEDLLAADPDELAEFLDDESITSTKIQRWIIASTKRVKDTLKLIEAEPEDIDDYDLLDYGF